MADVAITTANPTIAANVSEASVITAAVAITTANPTIAANITEASVSTADVAITTANPTIAASATGQAQATIALTTSNPTIAADVSEVIAATMDVVLTTQNPIIAVRVLGGEPDYIPGGVHEEGGHKRRRSRRWEAGKAFEDEYAHNADNFNPLIKLDKSVTQTKPTLDEKTNILDKKYIEDLHDIENIMALLPALKARNALIVSAFLELENR
jgi:hypothetical protein